MRVHTILTAAGSGSRFSKHSFHKNSLPKQFQHLNRKPVILYSLLALQKSRSINEIIVTANKKYFDFIHDLALINKITKLTALVEGGKTRFLSVRNAFLQISADPDDKILIHDAARPAVNVKMINTIITESKKYGEVIYGIKINETVKREFNNFVKETLVRDNLCAIQTPQIFRYEVLKNSYMKSTAKHDYTDESSMVESAGYRVRIIAGNRNNIKITTSDDLERMGKILKSLYRK